MVFVAEESRGKLSLEMVILVWEPTTLAGLSLPSLIHSPYAVSILNVSPPDPHLCLLFIAA